MDQIKIFDNFLSDKDLFYITEYLKTLKWKSGCIVNNNLLQDRDTPYWLNELTDIYFFNTYIKNIIENKMENNFKLYRVYLVGHTYTQNGNYHTDNKQKNYYTACFYINDLFNENDGNLYIKIPNKKEILSIEPITNRLIFFPSNYFHKANGFIKNNNLRICIAWKLYL